MPFLVTEYSKRMLMSKVGSGPCLCVNPASSLETMAEGSVFEYVTVREEIETGEAILSVRDYGIGIPMQQQASIFSHFRHDEQGRIALVNHQTEVLFGYSCQELLGQELEYLLPERFHTLHLQHRSRYLQYTVTRPMGVGLDLYGRRKDGTEFPVDISLSPLHSQAGLFIISSIRDITERRRLEQMARAQQALLQAMLDALPSGVYLVQGEQARLVFANRAATQVWGA